jgi:hypothetical protein
MLPNLPAYINIIFLLTVALTWILLLSTIKNKTMMATVTLVWLALTGLMAYRGLFTDTSSMPPKLIFAIVPAVLFIIIFLFSKKGQEFCGQLDLRMLTLLHVVRIPVELVLYWLAAHKAVPELMSFEGRNFDILSGLTAPVIYFVCFKGSVLKRRGLLLIWNFICLALLFNIVINAILAAPFPFQQFAFDQPNIAVLYFPFIWLPAFIVMAVLFSHLVAIKRLLSK